MSEQEIEAVLRETGVSANTWQSAARRLVEENRRLRSVCEDWAEKYEGWRDACLAAEAAVALAGALADEWETLLVDYICCGCASPNAVSTSRFADDLRAALTEARATRGEGS